MASRSPHFLAQTAALAMKDLRLEFRTKEGLNAAGAFALMILVLFSFAFDPTADETRAISGGLLWLVFSFSGALLLNRSFARERVNDCLDLLVAAPVSSAALLLGKAIANFVLLSLIELVAVPVYGIFYDVRWYEQWPMILLVFTLATWGIAVVGTVFSALTANLRLRELMLPTIVYPLLAPCLMAAIQLSIPLATGQPLTAEVAPYLRLLVAFDIIFTLLSVFVIEIILVG